MTAIRPYLSPEKAVEFQAMEAIVTAKIAAGFQYDKLPRLWRSTTARLEWVVAKAMRHQMAEKSISAVPAQQFVAPNDQEFDSLWAYCKANNRLLPKDWGTFYYVLAYKEQDARGNWAPPIPIDLSGCLCIHDAEAKRHMQLRFKQHVEWARSHAQLADADAYLRSLAEDEWIHFGEL